MKSNVYSTHEIDDINIAAQELIAGVKKDFELLRNTVGLLFCYSDMDSAELTQAISEKAGFDIIGCTCIANMEQRGGFHNMAATLLVLTAEDCSFSIAATEPVTKNNVASCVQSAYNEACSRLPEKPGLIFSIPPYILEIMLDEYTNAFNATAPGIPVVGGLPSYNADGDQNLVFINGKAYTDRLVMLAVSGNIQPRFSVQNVGSLDAGRKRRVTRAKNNTVYEVGNQRFTDYLNELGMPVEDLASGNSTVSFVANPLLIESTGEDGREFSFARTLHEINLEDGSGTAIGEIPENSTLSICPLERDEIEQKALEGIEDIKKKIGGVKDYEYSTVLAIPCIGRHLLMLPNSDVEVNQILKGLPDGLTMAGFYSYGEIGPQGTGKCVSNFAHNESLVLCAF